jgi:DNA polymerase-1
MRLGGFFNQPKTLAKPITAKPADNSQPLPVPGASLAKAIAPRRRPGDFGIVWPAIPPQQVKDYKPILTRADLEAYADRCEDLGVCSFDWETTASKAAREAFAAYQAEMLAKIDQAKATPIDTTDKDAVKQAEAEIAFLEAQLDSARKEYLKAPLDPHRGEICTVSLAAAPHEARVIPIDHKQGRVFEPGLSRDEARKLVMDILDRRIFRNRKVVKIAVNLSFETKYAAKYGKYILMPVADPLTMWVRCLQVADPKRLKDPKKPATGWGLKPATKAIFGVNMGEFTELLKKHGADFFDEIAADSGDGLAYSAEDADYGLQHYFYWSEIARQIKDERQGTNYYDWLHEIEMPFARVIGIMEYNGMAWDNQLAEMKRQEAYAAQAAAIEEMKTIIKDVTGLDVDPGKTGKTNGVKYVLFNMLKLPQGKPTDKGGVSLDEEALIDIKFMLENNLADLKEEKLLAVQLPEDWETIEIPPEEDGSLQAPALEGPAQLLTAEEFTARYGRWLELGKDEKAALRLRRRPPHPHKEAGLRLIELMGKIQKYTTLLSSHIDGRKKWQNPVTGKIHANYTPWTDTARLNSNNPNGQNVPRLDNDELGVRNFYVASPGKILFFIDFSGFELRIMAWKSGDQVMIEIFCTGGDMHRKTAATATGKPEDQVTKVERTDAKPVNFGITYGGTEHSLQKTFKTEYGMRKTLDECARLVDAVKKTYPGILKYQEEIALQAREDGFVSTIYGYIRLLPDINSTNKYDRQSAARQAANTPVQGTAADVMKRAQNEVYEETGRGTALVFDAAELGVDPAQLAADRGEAPPILVHGRTDMEAQIHDEMIFEMDDDPDVVEAAWKWIQATMEKPPIEGFPVPVEAEASVGYRWGQKIPVQKWLEEKRAAQKGA